MSTLLYLHGFESSPNSRKAILTEEWLNCRDLGLDFVCPSLPPFANATMSLLEAVIGKIGNRPVYLIGSSMGGFFATNLIEKYGVRGVLINPVVDPARGLESYLGLNTNYHNDQEWCIEAHHIKEYRAWTRTSITNKTNFLVLLQSGDEVLDYRDAVDYYEGCSMTIEQGGDHAFSNYADHLEDIFQFLVGGRSINDCT